MKHEYMKHITVDASLWRNDTYFTLTDSFFHSFIIYFWSKLECHGNDILYQFHWLQLLETVEHGSNVIITTRQNWNPPTQKSHKIRYTIAAERRPEYIHLLGMLTILKVQWYFVLGMECGDDVTVSMSVMRILPPVIRRRLDGMIYII